MVFELIVNPAKIYDLVYWKIFIIGILYSSIALFLSLWIFKGYVSIVMIALTVIASVILIHSLIFYEEEKDKKIKKELTLLKRHTKIIKIFTVLFLGFAISFALWYIFLPSATVSSVFNVQIETIKATTITPAGNFVNPASAFTKIFSNNLKILFFCIIFSFFYGAGAIFILAWNASVMGAAIGSYIRNAISQVTGAGYFHIAAFGLLRYLLHGLPEVIAYFIGALAGGIISVAIIRRNLSKKEFHHTLIDCLDLVLISIAILFFAALIEIFITPSII
ncbi:stage II sporulation protein M [Candidatus Woesearchaeota archaeon]|nr:stage II sporulation protein M [Candidatus Woesearchaeota archaeon]